MPAPGFMPNCCQADDATPRLRLNGRNRKHLATTTILPLSPAPLGALGGEREHLTQFALWRQRFLPLPRGVFWRRGLGRGAPFVSECYFPAFTDRLKAAG